MRRRDLLTAFAGMAAAPSVLLSGSARAQQPKRVAALMTGSVGTTAQNNLTILERSLGELGWKLGQNLQLEVRWSEADAQRARAFAAELVGMAPDVILASTTPNLSAVRLATRT